MVSNRPRIQPTLTLLDKRLELAAAIMVVVLWCVTMYCYLQLPDIIPTHFSGDGQPDGYGSKSMLLVMSAVGTILCAGLRKLNQYPHIFNYMVTVTEQNAAQQYLITTRLLRYLALGIPVVFTAILLLTYLTVFGEIDGIGNWFLPVVLAIFIVPTIGTIVQSRR